MRSVIITNNKIEGRCRKRSTVNPLSYMDNLQPCTLNVECEFDAKKFDWDLRVISMQHQIDAYFRDTYGKPAEFGTLTHEQVAAALLSYYPGCVRVTVTDETQTGARVYKRRRWF